LGVIAVAFSAFEVHVLDQLEAEASADMRAVLPSPDLEPSSWWWDLLRRLFECAVCAGSPFNPLIYKDFPDVEGSDPQRDSRDRPA
jgi:hypothetical protein